MSTTHQAIVGGVRWRLKFRSKGLWHVERLVGKEWESIFSGNDGMDGVREAIEYAHARPEWFALAGADVLRALADVAESGMAA
jgi:hypothetical protein